MRILIAVFLCCSTLLAQNVGPLPKLKTPNQNQNGLVDAPQPQPPTDPIPPAVAHETYKGPSQAPPGLIEPIWKTKSFIIPQAIFLGATLTYADSNLQEGRHNCGTRAAGYDATMAYGIQLTNFWVQFIATTGLRESHYRTFRTIGRVLPFAATAFVVRSTIKDRTSCW
jgi:hypothetical protein